MTTDEFLERVDGVRAVPGGFMVRCPAHEDRRQSLSVKDAGEELVIKCHAGCTFEAILAAVPPVERKASERRVEAAYTYRDADGAPLFDVVRYFPKDFRQRRADGTWSLNGVERVPYRLPELLASTRGVVIVEGEKDVDRLAGLGIVATCNPGGAGKWRAEYAAHLRGRTVVIIPDHDAPGRAHADDVARSLAGEDVRLLELPGLAPKGDVSDWLAAGHDVDELRTLLRDAPPYVPGPGLVEGLRFYTPRELAAMTRPTTDWIVCPGLVAIGAITETDGKVKAAGKTTFLQWMADAIVAGDEFLGSPTRKSRIVYVTEQSRQTFTDALRRIGRLAERSDELLVLFREDIGATPWPDVVRATRRDDYDVVVFDTIGKLAGIKEENSAGEWAVAMAPLQDLAASGRAVIVARHDRKSGGEVGDSGRGSSQASGDVDIILAIRRPEGNQPGTRRVIETLSRYPDTPDKFVVELTDAGYRYLGTDEAVATVAVRDFLSSAIGSEKRTNGIGATADRLVELGSDHAPRFGRTLVTDALAAMYAERVIDRTGAGRKGDPFLYVPLEVADEDLEDGSSGTITLYTDERIETARVMSSTCVDPTGHALTHFTTRDGERRCRTCSPLSLVVPA